MRNRTTIQITESLRKELKMLAAKRDASYQDLLKEMVSIFKELDQTRTIISIPRKLDEKVKKIIEKTDIHSTSEYVTFMLRMHLAEEQLIPAPSGEDIIKQKLKRLGYL